MVPIPLLVPAEYNAAEASQMSDRGEGSARAELKLSATTHLALRPLTEGFLGVGRVA